MGVETPENGSERDYVLAWTLQPVEEEKEEEEEEEEKKKKKKKKKKEEKE